MRWTCRSVAVVVLTVLSVAASACVAELKLPGILGDNMVVQQGRPAPIWGWAQAGKKVTVRFAGQSVSATADKDGKWRVTLAPLKPGEPAEMVIAVEGGQKKSLKNVLAGEVWVCSGQSNMAWTVSSAKNPKEEIAAARYPKMRLFTVRRVTVFGIAYPVPSLTLLPHCRWPSFSNSALPFQQYRSGPMLRRWY